MNPHLNAIIIIIFVLVLLFVVPWVFNKIFWVFIGVILGAAITHSFYSAFPRTPHP